MDAAVDIQLEVRLTGVVIPVRAQPGARKNGIAGIHAGQLKVCVTQAPEKGKANASLVEVLASELQLKRSQITLLSGETSTQKKFLVADITLDILHERLRRSLAQQ